MFTSRMIQFTRMPQRAKTERQKVLKPHPRKRGADGNSLMVEVDEDIEVPQPDRVRYSCHADKVDGSTVVGAYLDDSGLTEDERQILDSLLRKLEAKA